MKRTKKRRAILAELRRLYGRIPDVQCKGLCAHSCGPIPMTRAEAEEIERDSGGPIPPPRGLDCPLLAAGRCSAYEARPLICRMYGAVPRLACPHGCRPTRYLTDKDQLDIMARYYRLMAEDGGAFTHEAEFEGLSAELGRYLAAIAPAEDLF